MATATLNANIDFATGNVGEDATHYSLWDALTGGNKLSDGTLTNNPDALTANQFYQIESGDIVFTLPEGADGLTAGNGETWCGGHGHGHHLRSDARRRTGCERYRQHPDSSTGSDSKRKLDCSGLTAIPAMALSVPIKTKGAAPLRPFVSAG